MKILTFILGSMHTNCYFIIDETLNKCVIIDPAAEFDKIMAKIKEYGYEAEYILLTHSHFDHMMALEDLRNALNIPLCVHEHDAEAVTNNEHNYIKQFSGMKINKRLKPAEVVLKDGDIIKTGNIEIKVLHTPGHTMGSVCYFIENNIVTGDTLFKEDIGRYDLYGGDYIELLASLKKLKNIDTSSHDYKIYPGHGSSSRLIYEKENNIYLK